jgi:cell division protein FtsL
MTAGPYVVRRPVVNDYLVRERDRRRVRELLRLLLLVAPLGLALLAYTWVHLESLDAGFRIRGLEQELHGLERQERQLRLEAAWLKSPGRVEDLAETELGLAPPRPDQVVFWTGEAP